MFVEEKAPQICLYTKLLNEMHYTKKIAQGLEKGVEKNPKALCLQKNDGES